MSAVVELIYESRTPRAVNRRAANALSLAVLAFAICDMKVLESVTSCASSCDFLLFVSPAPHGTAASVPVLGSQTDLWSRYSAPSLTSACS
jgi:hypothetical protein